MIGPQTQAAEYLDAMKYRGEGESFREKVNRVASALKDDDAHFHALRDMMLHQRFVPAGRVQAAMGSTKHVTAFNCAVSQTIEDSFVDGEGSIMARATEAAATMRMGCGMGYDFSTLRPRGDLVKTLQSHASGPVSFMRIFNGVCLATVSAGHRRGAQMGVLRVDHPDIEEFIRAKQNNDQLTGFNLSIAITDEFMNAALRNSLFTLRWGGKEYRTVDAAALWEMIMRSTWDWGEPGVIFIDRVNWMNNLYYCEKIAASNPCAEQMLPPGGMCNLGSFNLVKYLTKNERWRYSFDYGSFIADIPAAVRAMDNVNDRSKYPLEAQRQEALSKRRVGLGVMGLANALEACGLPYASPMFNLETEKILKTLRDEAYRASIMLAKEKGAFPLYHDELYPVGKFVRGLPPDIKYAMSKYGVRNSHLTSIAPTGTISQTCDNVSSGIEPVWAYSTKRNIFTPDGVKETVLVDYGMGFLETQGRLARDVKPLEHADVVLAAQPYVDSAISKTVNVPHDLPWSEFKEVYQHVWAGGGKACATFTNGGLRGGLLGDAEACFIDPETGERSCE